MFCKTKTQLNDQVSALALQYTAATQLMGKDAGQDGIKSDARQASKLEVSANEVVLVPT